MNLYGQAMSEILNELGLSTPIFIAFVVAVMTLLKRVTLIANDSVIEAVHYPIFPSDSDAAWVLDYLKRH